MGMEGTLRMYQAADTLMALSFLSFGLSLVSAFINVSLQHHINYVGQLDLIGHAAGAVLDEDADVA